MQRAVGDSPVNALGRGGGGVVSPRIPEVGPICGRNQGPFVGGIGGHLWEESGGICGRNRGAFVGGIGGHLWEESGGICGRNRGAFVGGIGGHLWEESGAEPHHHHTTDSGRSRSWECTDGPGFDSRHSQVLRLCCALHRPVVTARDAGPGGGRGTKQCPPLPPPTPNCRASTCWFSTRAQCAVAYRTGVGVDRRGPQTPQRTTWPRVGAWQANIRTEEEGGGGCVPKMARPDFPYFKCRFFPRWSLWSGGGGWHDAFGVLFSCAAGGAYWPIAIHCPSLGPFPSAGGGAHRPLITLCPLIGGGGGEPPPRGKKHKAQACPEDCADPGPEGLRVGAPRMQRMAHRYFWSLVNRHM